VTKIENDLAIQNKNFPLKLSALYRRFALNADVILTLKFGFFACMRPPKAGFRRTTEFRD